MGKTATVWREKLDATPQLAVSAPVPIGSIEQIETGDVLIQPGTPLPPGLVVSLRRIGRWNLVVGHRSHGFDRELRQRGWHFFYIVPEIEENALALTRGKALRKAFESILREAQARRLNAVEVGMVNVRKILGVYRATVRACTRHIRDSPYLRGPRAYHPPAGQWNFTRIFRVRNSKVPQVKGI